MFEFELIAVDAASGARAGVLHTPHGDVPTPVFMPVGTQGVVKTLTERDIHSAGATMILNNLFHLYLRPGVETIERLGGLHKFQSWDGGIITDSGGFQVFSLVGLSDITDEGVHFKSPYNGSSHFFSPERVVELTMRLAPDIGMVLDECLSYPATEQQTRDSMEMTLRWARRAVDAYNIWMDANPDDITKLFGIIQGGFYPDLRYESTLRTMEIGFPGYAIGGLSVGEPKGLLFEMLGVVLDVLPPSSPRYLMGVGPPDDIIRAVSMGVDMFDCVVPTRNARNGSVFTWRGKFSVKAGAYRADPRPIDPECNCYTCRTYSRGYLRHLFNAGELSAPHLATIHSIYFFEQFMGEMRQSIIDGNFTDFRRRFETDYSSVTETAL